MAALEAEPRPARRSRSDGWRSAGPTAAIERAKPAGGRLFASFDRPRLATSHLPASPRPSWRQRAQAALGELPCATQAVLKGRSLARLDLAQAYVQDRVGGDWRPSPTPWPSATRTATCRSCARPRGPRSLALARRRAGQGAGRASTVAAVRLTPPGRAGPWRGEAILAATRKSAR